MEVIMGMYYKKTVFAATIVLVVFVNMVCATESSERPIGPSWNALNNYIKTGYTPQKTGMSCPGRDVMICLMPDSFAQAFRAYAVWKHKSGTFIKIVKFSEIGASNTTASCSTAIKPYLQKAFETWKYRPSHVLLIGDAGVFPFAKWTSPTEGTYFANITTDAYFGEVDSLNYYEPDILVGRLCVKDTAEMSNLLKKIMNYERRPPTANTNWFKSIVALSGNQVTGNIFGGSGDSTYQAETVREVSLFQMERGFTVDTLMCTDVSTVDLQTVINSINKGCSFINFRGQGWAQGLLTPCYQFFVPDLPEVQNAGMLPFLTAFGCGTTMFDVSPGGLSGSDVECFGEEMMRLGTAHAPSGAIAVLGSAGESHSYWNNAMDKGLYTGMFERGLWSPGQALIAAIDTMYKSDLNRDTTNFQARSYILLGDPSTHVWKDVPQMAALTGPTSIPFGTSDQTFTVKIGPQPVKNALVCASGSLSDSITYVTGFTDSNGSVTLSINATTSGALSLVARGECMFPIEQAITVGNVGTIRKFSQGAAPFSLTAGFPNPYVPAANISYSLVKAGFTTLTIYSLGGALVRTVVSGIQSAGSHSIIWNGRDNKGMAAARGVYFISLRQANLVLRQRITKIE
jgi:hypothetical protein